MEKTRWYQFELRSLFLLTALVAVVASMYSSDLPEKLRRRYWSSWEEGMFKHGFELDPPAANGDTSFSATAQWGMNDSAFDVDLRLEHRRLGVPKSESSMPQWVTSDKVSLPSRWQMTGYRHLTSCKIEYSQGVIRLLDPDEEGGRVLWEATVEETEDGEKSPSLCYHYYCPLGGGQTEGCSYVLLGFADGSEQDKAVGERTASHRVVYKVTRTETESGQP